MRSPFSFPFSLRRRSKNAIEQGMDAPMVEVFGGTLALLIILFALVNLIVSEDIQAMLERSTENAEFKVSWTEGGEGFIVISHADKLQILETNVSVAKADICTPQGAFMPYVQRLYDNPKQQIIFAIVEGGVATMAKARNCMLHRNPNRAISIGWVIANKDLLSTVALEDLPPRIKRALGKTQ